MPENASRFAGVLFDQFEDEVRVPDWGGDDLFTRMPSPRPVDDAPAPRFRPTLTLVEAPEERRFAPSGRAPGGASPVSRDERTGPADRRASSRSVPEPSTRERAERLGLAVLDGAHVPPVPSEAGPSRPTAGEAPRRSAGEAPRRTAGEAPRRTAGEAPRRTADERSLPARAADHTPAGAYDLAAATAADYTPAAADDIPPLTAAGAETYGLPIVRKWDGSLDASPEGRSTRVITGRPDGVPRLLHLAPDHRRRRPPRSRTPADFIGARPERIVAWAFALGLLLILIAISTADAATL
jgi:hypothetical protein